MEKHKYTCNYCFEEFIPTRRRVQKFCSATCRSKSHHAKISESNLPTEQVVSTDTPLETKIKKMSLSGIGNATAGTLAADLLKSALTKNENKPATKGDLNILLAKLNDRYHLIKNMAPNLKGEYPYFDLVENVVIYSK